jgi:beta-aspartyl-dipeptidase (metallo-type)
MWPPDNHAFYALFTVIRGADVYAPRHLGPRTIVISGDKIFWLGQDKELPESIRRLDAWSSEIDASGSLVLPGLIDPHQHSIGAGGEQGFGSRRPEVSATELLECGITTSIGCLGTDVTTRHLTSLLAKTRQLEEDGLSAYMLTGGFTVPPKTITGSVDDDLVIIDKVIGVGEVGISDRRACDPSLADLARLVTQAHRGGSLGGKPGVTLFHIGNGRGCLQPLRALLEEHDIEPASLIADHVNRSVEHVAEAVDLAQRGVHVCMDTVNGDLPRWIGMYRNAGGPFDKLSLCSDAQTAGGDVRKLLHALVDTVRDGVPLEEILPSFTASTANAWHMTHKGRIAPGCDADLVFVDPASLGIERVIARGRVCRRGDSQAHSVRPSPDRPILDAITMTLDQHPVEPEQPLR